jgi:hypothetical protein
MDSDQWNSCFDIFLIKLGIRLEPSPVHSAREEVKDLCLDMLQRVENPTKPSDMSQKDCETSMWTKLVVYQQLPSQLSPSASMTLSTLSISELRLTVASKLMDHVLAGTDTSAWTLTYIVHELSQRPNLQSSLRSELLSLSAPISYPQRVIQSNGASKMMTNLPSPRQIDTLPSSTAFF